MTAAGTELYQGAYQPQILVHALSYDLDRPLIYVGEQVISARAFRDLVSQYLQALQSLGLGRGAKIGVLASNRPEVLCITSACLLGEFVLVPLHPLGSLDDHSYLIADSAMDALVIDAPAFAERGAALAELAPTLKLLTLGPARSGTDLAALATRMQPAPLIAPQTNGDEPYRLSYSGGTTGKPKAVVGTHRIGIAVLNIQLAEWEWPSQIRQLMCAPLSHAGAAMFLPTLLRGGSLVILPGFDPIRVMEAIQKHRITCALLVPTMIYALLDHPRLGDFDLSSLETIFYGASAMSPTRLREGIQRLGPIFFQFYGQVEAPMTVCVLRRAEHDVDSPERLASCGRPVPWVQVDLLDDEMRPVPHGEPGEICVRGTLVMSGYHQRPEQTAEAFAGGWLHTGDVAIRDPQGFLRIVDRKKDMIVTGGFNVYPREVEDVLGSHPAVSANAVIGIPDAHWGEAVTAVVVLRHGMEPCADELRALVRERKGSVQTPKSIFFVDALPLTPVGKPDKKALRAHYGNPQQKAAAA
ncbi:AMP-binding protein [Solimonas terrae]|uniref:AMP-binding protein n=1 Tax=Solimonas terrae TaxID=1396819 RepID=A0A6M2BWG9_9GAMM|nr:AMP-binding protein [Solimonas terrae]NGY06992.1 AMP-binding protein [Solimonas terrae]